MSTLAHIMDQLQSDFNQFRAEVSITNAILVHPTWQTHTHHFPATLWAYIDVWVFQARSLFEALGWRRDERTDTQNARISGSISAARSFGRLGGNLAMGPSTAVEFSSRRFEGEQGGEESERKYSRRYSSLIAPCSTVI